MSLRSGVQRVSPLVASPLRVLHAYAGNLYGGIEALLATLARARELEPRLDTAFALGFEGRLADELRAAGAPPRMLGALRFRKPWRILAARRRLAAMPMDALICHGVWTLAALGPAARRAGVPLVFWMHDAANLRPHWTERLARRDPPDLVLANSRHTRATLDRLFPGVPSEVLACPVAAPAAFDRAAARQDLRAAIGADPRAVVILQACRLERWKGHALLLAALARLRDQPGWEAWIAGGVQRPHEQPYLDELHAAARAAGIADRVRFLGQRSDVPRLLAAADIHCQPNTGPEPFGIAFVEALDAGLPVVTTRLGGGAEIVNDTCGILVEPDDTAALAAALRGLIVDPAARADLGAAGPARARALSDPAVILDRLAVMLESLTARRETRSR